MSELIDKGYAEQVPLYDINAEGNKWCIPHHAVFHKKKNKLRIVFDCSAEYAGEALNSHLLQGPDLINNLTGILCHFREEHIAFTCDIEGMFHQVGVNIEHRNLLRFLWWDDVRLEKVTDYRMTVHLFGAKSSPGCVNFTLRKTAEIFEDVHGHEAASFIRDNFYVDDGLKSVATKEEAIMLIANSRKLCNEGGFRLHKILSNDKDVVRSVSPDDRAKNIQKIDLGSEDLPIERTLGVQWCVQSDSFVFRVEFQDRPLTRRGILSAVSSVFDPLGLVSPVILRGKKILQELCRDGAKWDDPIKDELRNRWEKWRDEIYLLSQLKIPRCYKPHDFGKVYSVEIHHFSDASLEGLGQCSYLRLKDDSGRVCTSLIMSKSRVTPSKAVTVPRLELAAAVISVKVSCFIAKEISFKDAVHFFWTDSKIVLGYINNEKRRFHIFVGNRVQEIREHSAPSDWNHVSTKDNPADLASRGLGASELIDNKMWWNGPEFLITDVPLPTGFNNEQPDPNDPELRKETSTVLATQTETQSSPMDILQRLERFSSWHAARRAVAVSIKLKNILLKRIGRNQDQVYIPVDTVEIEASEKVIIRALQEQAFPSEVKTLRKLSNASHTDRITARRRNEVLKKGSKLYRLDPYVCDDGLVRVGGRIRRANLPKDITHPVILPRHHHITRLIIDYYHVISGHSGRGITLNAIRASGYWIVAGGAAVTSCVWNCVKCRKLRRMPEGQRMADLPDDRIDDAPPFTYSAVDFFGPFMIKEGRKELKRYGALFNCLSSRAIHIEVAASMSTDSFLNAYRRFVCRRGPVRLLRSDRGSKFVGAKGEQAAALANMDQDKVRRELLKDKCDWINFKMNVPHASHMGGVWERMIRCARNALSALLLNHGDRLDDESLRTLLTEAEAIVNSRPLTYVDTKSPDSPIPLSPSQILTLKTNIVMPPPGNFVREDLYLRRRWRRVQFLADQFWSRWKLEFLPTMQERKKWVNAQRNIKVDDIVLLIDDNTFRNNWPLARVVETHPDEDGLVRSVTIACGQSKYQRPVHKLILLLGQ